MGAIGAHQGERMAGNREAWIDAARDLLGLDPDDGGEPPEDPTIRESANSAAGDANQEIFNQAGVTRVPVQNENGEWVMASFADARPPGGVLIRGGTGGSADIYRVENEDGTKDYVAVYS